jgi:cobalamin synthase
MREFGFVNGDGLGFMIEIVELLLFVVLVFVVT